MYIMKVQPKTSKMGSDPSLRGFETSGDEKLLLILALIRSVFIIYVCTLFSLFLICLEESVGE